MQEISVNAGLKIKGFLMTVLKGDSAEGILPWDLPGTLYNI